MRILSSAMALLLAGCGWSQDAPLVVESGGLAVHDGRTLAESVGLETLGGAFTPLLEAGCELPCRSTQRFSTAEDAQTAITLSMYRGNAERASENHFLGRFAVRDIPPLPRGEPTVEVEFAADSGGITIRARDPSGTLRPILVPEGT